jgi:hypothetical protein
VHLLHPQKKRTPDEALKIVVRIIAFYQIKFKAFVSSYYTNIQRVEEAFSFSIPGSRVVSDALLVESNAAAIQTAWFGKYLNEFIKVKMYLMHEFVNAFSSQLSLMKDLLDTALNVVKEFRDRVDPNKSSRELDTALRNTMEMQQYFDRLIELRNYIMASSFIHYKKYVDVAQMYQKTRAHELYVTTDTRGMKPGRRPSKIRCRREISEKRRGLCTNIGSYPILTRHLNGRAKHGGAKNKTSASHCPFNLFYLNLFYCVMVSRRCP